MIVVDASPLIVLAKIGRLMLLKDLYGAAAIGPQVKAEVVDRGRAVDAAGVREVERGLQARWIRELRPLAKEKERARYYHSGSGLGQGEAEAIALARSRGLMVVLDDKEARALADREGVRYLGTAGILLAAFAKGHLTYDQLEAAMVDLGQVLWLSPAVVAEVLRRARGLAP